MFYCDHHRHLVCVPYSIQGLHEMAQKLNIKKCWFHKDHYNIPALRIKEIQAKCSVVSTRTIYNIIHNLPSNLYYYDS